MRTPPYFRRCLGFANNARLIWPPRIPGCVSPRGTTLPTITCPSGADPTEPSPANHQPSDRTATPIRRDGPGRPSSVAPGDVPCAGTVADRFAPTTANGAMEATGDNSPPAGGHRRAARSIRPSTLPTQCGSVRIPLARAVPVVVSALSFGQFGCAAGRARSSAGWSPWCRITRSTPRCVASTHLEVIAQQLDRALGAARVTPGRHVACVPAYAALGRVPVGTGLAHTALAQARARIPRHLFSRVAVRV